MNRIYFVVIGVFFCFINLHGQTIKIGIKGGLNYANLNGSSIQTDAITSYHAGLLANISLLDSFSIQPEILYSTQGASYKNALTEYKNELGYIQIPIMFKIGLTNSISLELGPQGSFLLSKKDDVVLNNYNSYDFSANAGVGLKLTKALFLQARYSLGLTDIAKNTEVKNSVFQLSAGVMF